MPWTLWLEEPEEELWAVKKWTQAQCLAEGMYLAEDTHLAEDSFKGEDKGQVTPGKT